VAQTAAVDGTIMGVAVFANCPLGFANANTLCPEVAAAAAAAPPAVTAVAIGEALARGDGVPRAIVFFEVVAFVEGATDEGIAATLVAAGCCSCRHMPCHRSHSHSWLRRPSSCIIS